MNAFPLEQNGKYLIRYKTVVRGNPWLANVESVTDLSYQINGRWYIRKEFEDRYTVFEELENTVKGYVTKHAYYENNG